MAVPKLLCAVGCGVCALLVVLIVVLISVGTVEPIEYGIKYNSITKTVSTDEVYPGGWYFIGPFDSFFVFPSTLLNIDFTDYAGAQSPPLELKDSDGQTITLSFSMQYRLQQENIGKLYAEFQKTYETTFISYIDKAVRTKVGGFDSTMFWSNRQQAGEIMRASIDVELQKRYANCTNLQIINVKLSEKREASLVQTQVTKQQGKTKTNEQKAKEIRSSISVNASQAEKNITQIQGGAQANAKHILANASSVSTQMTINATSDAYKQLDTSIGINPSNGLDKFIYYADLQTSDANNYLFGIKNALIKLTK